jgi:hypothetical protein
MRLGERQHLAIMDNFGNGTMVMVIDEGVTLAPQSPAP